MSPSVFPMNLCQLSKFSAEAKGLFTHTVSSSPSLSKFNIAPMATDRLTHRLGSEPILVVNVNLTVIVPEVVSVYGRQVHIEVLVYDK